MLARSDWLVIDVISGHMLQFIERLPIRLKFRISPSWIYTVKDDEVLAANQLSVQEP